MDLPAAGNHNIRTNTGQFLSLANPDGAVVLVDVAIGYNEVWDFQIIAGNYTIWNVGQNAFLQSDLAPGAQIIGGDAPMNWTLVPNGVGFLIRPTANNNFRWNDNGGAVNLLNLGGDLALEDAHRFTIL